MSENWPKKCKNVRKFLELKCIVTERKWYFSSLWNWTGWFRWALQNLKIPNFSRTFLYTFIMKIFWHFYARVNFRYLACDVMTRHFFAKSVRKLPFSKGEFFAQGVFQNCTNVRCKFQNKIEIKKNCCTHILNSINQTCWRQHFSSNWN